MAAPIVVNWNPHVRQAADFWIGGLDFTSGTLRTYAHRSITTISEANQKDEIKASIDGGYTARNPTTISWAGTGTNETDVVIEDTYTLKAGGLPLEGSSPNTFCLPFIVRNGDGDSPTCILNKPKFWGMPGTNPAKMYVGKLYTIVGRNLCSPNVDTSVWLWDGTTPVNTSGLFKCTILNGRGGTANSGSSLNRSHAANVIDFEIPSGLTAGNYYLLVFTNENRYGITAPTVLQVTVVSGEDPWAATSNIDTSLLSTLSGTDISQALTLRLMANDNTASATAPYIIQLPAGVFYISHLLAWPSHIGLRGAGKDATVLMPNPALRGVANSAGSMYYTLDAYSSANSNVYAGNLSGIYTGDQRIISSPVLIRVRGSNTLFQDLTLKTAPNNYQQTVTGCIGAQDGINEGRCIGVRFDNPLALNNDQKTIMRYGRWRYWRFQDCDYDCDKAFNPATSPTAVFSNNGGFDDSIIEGGEYRGVHGVEAQSAFCDLGRGSLLRDVTGTNSRRFISINSGHHAIESVVFNNHLSGMLGQYGANEAILTESRECFLGTVTTAGATYIQIDGDTTVRTRQVIAIVAGKGRGQVRVIASSGLSIHTVEENWDITPDNTSVVQIHGFATDLAYVTNRLEGMVGGISLFGSAMRVEVRDNYIWGSGEGVVMSCLHNAATSQISVSGWHTLSGNTYNDGAGLHAIGIRSSTDIASHTWPLVSRLSVSRETKIRDVVNTLWAGVGTSASNGDEDDAAINSVNLIDFVAVRGETYYSDPSVYGHTISAKAMLRRQPWALSNKGVGNFTLRTVTVDGVSVADTAVLWKETADYHTISQYSLNEVVEDGIESPDLTDLENDVATLQTDLDAAEATITSQGTTISSHTTSISTLNTTTASHTSTLSSQATTISSHTSSLSTHTTQITTLQTDLDALEATVAGLELEVSPEQIQEIEDDLRADLQSSLPLGINIVRVVNPRASDEGLTIVQGDSYENEYRIRWLDIREVWPSLTGATIAFYIDRLDGTNALTQAGSVVSQTDVRVALTSVQTGALALGAYTYRVVATLADTTTRTLVVGSLIVV